MPADDRDRSVREHRELVDALQRVEREELRRVSVAALLGRDSHHGPSNEADRVDATQIEVGAYDGNGVGIGHVAGVPARIPAPANDQPALGIDAGVSAVHVSVDAGARQIHGTHHLTVPVEQQHVLRGRPVRDQRRIAEVRNERRAESAVARGAPGRRITNDGRCRERRIEQPELPAPRVVHEHFAIRHLLDPEHGAERVGRPHRRLRQIDDRNAFLQRRDVRRGHRRAARQRGERGSHGHRSQNGEHRSFGRRGVGRQAHVAFDARDVGGHRIDFRLRREQRRVRHAALRRGKLHETGARPRELAPQRRELPRDADRIGGDRASLSLTLDSRRRVAGAGSPHEADGEHQHGRRE